MCGSKAVFAAVHFPLLWPQFLPCLTGIQPQFQRPVFSDIRLYRQQHPMLSENKVLRFNKVKWRCGWSKCDGKMISHGIQRKQEKVQTCPAQVFGKVPDGEVFVFVLFYYVKHQSLSYFVFLVSLFPRNKATSENSKAAGFLNRSRKG